MAAIDDTGAIRGAVAFDDFTKGSAEVHIALESPMALKTIIPACFIFPFVQLGLRVVVGVTPASNERALRLNRRLGFKETHRVKDAWDVGVDMVVQEIRPDDCERWLRPAHGKAVAHG